MRQRMLRLFMRLSRPLFGKGIGDRFPALGRLYGILFLCLKPKQPIMIFEVQGSKMYADLRRHWGMGPGVIHGSFEKAETELFKKVVKEGMTVVDMGAHIGYYALLAAGLVGKNGKVYAFEPHPDNYDLLIKNIALNGYDNIVPVQKAVSNKSGIIKFYLSTVSTGDHRAYYTEGRESIEVEAISLDDFFRERRRIDIIKMDIEGAEMAVLEGSKEILKANRDLKLFTEFWPAGIKRSGYSPEQGLKRLVELGFKLFNLDSRGRVTPVDIDTIMQMCAGEDISNTDTRLYKFTNLYAARN